MIDSVILRDSLELVQRVFRDVRPELMAVFGKIEYTRKSDRSKVTAWDLKIENDLQAELQANFPGLGFEGEETGSSGSKDRYWLVDPIDGTSSFIRGLRYCTNMAALVDDGQVTAAVIYDFVHDEMYTAIKGEGAFKDGVRLAVATQRPADDAVLFSFSRDLFSKLREALSSIHMNLLLPIGAAGHSYCMLAEGKIDGIVALQSTAKKHDNAPGMLIAEEAGAVVLSYSEEVGVDRNEFIIATPVVADAIEKSGLI